MAVDILIVDDDKFSQKVIGNTFKDEFSTHFASDGEEGLQKAKEVKPDLIILDVEMPGLTGYEVCAQLKQDPVTKQVPIVFLSGNGSLRDKMQGYEVGGDDYLIKPFEPEALSAKIKVLLKYRDQTKELHQQYEVAQKTANIAMSGSSELGQAMLFIENSFTIHDYEELANALFTMTDRMALRATLMFISENNEPFWYSSSGAVSPLETQVLNMIHTEKRIYDFGCRTVIAFPNVSILIKNMPIDDMERYGRIKDLFPVILGALNGKILSLNTERALQQQSSEISESNERIKGSLLELSGSLQDNQDKITRVMRKMLDELSMHLPYLGLEEDQEEYILNRIEEAITDSMQLVNSANAIKSIFSTVVNEMSQITEKQNRIINEMFDQKNKLNQNEEDDDQSYSMDVELF